MWGRISYENGTQIALAQGKPAGGLYWKAVHGPNGFSDVAGVRPFWRDQNALVDLLGGWTLTVVGE
jgi:hypothetical protein